MTVLLSTPIQYHGSRIGSQCLRSEDGDSHLASSAPESGSSLLVLLSHSHWNSNLNRTVIGEMIPKNVVARLTAFLFVGLL